MESSSRFPSKARRLLDSSLSPVQNKYEHKNDEEVLLSFAAQCSLPLSPVNEATAGTLPSLPDSGGSSHSEYFHESLKNQVQRNQAQVKNLGEKLIALQQLVSPFGKNDTASVLMEAISYIKFLQNQIQVLSSSNLISSNKKGIDGLRGRGLCLVPISCTMDVVENNNGTVRVSGISGYSKK